MREKQHDLPNDPPKEATPLVVYVGGQRRYDASVYYLTQNFQILGSGARLGTLIDLAADLGFKFVEFRRTYVPTC